MFGRRGVRREDAAATQLVGLIAAPAGLHGPSRCDNIGAWSLVRRPHATTPVLPTRHRSSFVRAAILAAIASVLGAESTSAQDPQRAPETRPVGRESTPIPIPTDLVGGEPLDVRLDDALRLGRKNNLPLRAAELTPLLHAHDVRVAEGFFEPELFGRAELSETKSPSSNVFQPEIVRRTVGGELGVRQRIATGALYEVAFTPLRLRQSASISGFPSQLYTLELSGRVTQPLLRGAWTDSALYDVHAAEEGVTGAQARFGQSVQDTLLQVVVAYWELVFAREDWLVNAQALELANEQLRITNERIRVRELAERDRVFDEADVARRREALIRAENEIRRSEDELRELLFGERDEQLWTRGIRPVTPIEVEFVSPGDDWREAATAALANRPEIVAARSDVRAAELAWDEASRGMLPQLDLVGEYSTDGTRTTSPDAWRDATDLEYPDWRLGLEFAIPLGNTSARAARDRALVALEQTRRQLHSLEIVVLREVRTALRDLATLAESVRAARESQRLAETQLDTARELLRVGRGTIFEVQQRNQELLDARRRLLRNQLDYRIAESRLQHSRGALTVPE